MKRRAAKTGTSSSRERAENIGFRPYDCVFRLNAGGATGLGHLRRSLVLAQALRKRGLRKIAFVTRTPEAVKPEITPFDLIPIAPAHSEFSFWKEFSKAGGPRMTVFDCYAISVSMLKALRSILPLMVFIDDFGHLPNYPVDVLINPNVHGRSMNYKALPFTRILRGPEYALIDPFFRNVSPVDRNAKRPLCFVSLGGAPGFHALEKLIKIFSRFRGGLRVDIATGLTHNRPRLPQGSPVRYRSGAEARRAMKACHFAFSASGVTSSELAAMGKPSLLVILAKNQERISRAMHRLKMARSLGWFLKLKEEKIAAAIKKFMSDSALQKRLSARARKAIDGKGADRLANALVHAFKNSKEKK